MNTEFGFICLLVFSNEKVAMCSDTENMTYVIYIEMQQKVGYLNQ